MKLGGYLKSRFHVDVLSAPPLLTRNPIPHPRCHHRSGRRNRQERGASPRSASFCLLRETGSSFCSDGNHQPFKPAPELALPAMLKQNLAELGGLRGDGRS